MIYGYFDESGHESVEYVVIAGFFGRGECWDAFVPNWKFAMGQRKTLHMTSLRWKKDSTRRLLKRLATIPEECGLQAAVGAVRVSDYADLVADDERAVRIKGYEAALAPLVINVLRGVPKDERIEFVFEEQREYAPSIASIMELAERLDMDYKVTSEGIPKLLKWGMVPKGTTVKTDPADYLAYAVRENLTNPETQKAKWSYPLIEASGHEIHGAILSRDEIRRRITTAKENYKRMFSP